MRSLLSVLALLVVLAGAAAAAAASVPKLRTCAGTSVVRPTGLFVIACGDANTEIEATRWSSWTSASAAGVTRFGINFCKPYCAASKMSWFPASRVRLVAPRHGLFTKIVVTYVLHGKTTTFVGYPRTR